MLAGKVAMSRRLDSCESQRVLSPGYVNYPDSAPAWLFLVDYFRPINSGVTSRTALFWIDLGLPFRVEFRFYRSPGEDSRDSR